MTSWKIALATGALAIACVAPVAPAEAGGKKITVNCTVTVAQRGYVAGVCTGKTFFGTLTKRTFRLGQKVTVTGYKEFDGEIARPRVR